MEGLFSDNNEMVEFEDSKELFSTDVANKLGESISDKWSSSTNARSLLLLLLLLLMKDNIVLLFDDEEDMLRSFIVVRIVEGEGL